MAAEFTDLRDFLIALKASQTQALALVPRKKSNEQANAVMDWYDAQRRAAEETTTGVFRLEHYTPKPARTPDQKRASALKGVATKKRKAEEKANQAVAASKTAVSKGANSKHALFMDRITQFLGEAHGPALKKVRQHRIAMDAKLDSLTARLCDSPMIAALQKSAVVSSLEAFGVARDDVTRILASHNQILTTRTRTCLVAHADEFELLTRSGSYPASYCGTPFDARDRFDLAKTLALTCTAGKNAFNSAFGAPVKGLMPLKLVAERPPMRDTAYDRHGQLSWAQSQEIFALHQNCQVCASRVNTFWQNKAFITIGALRQTDTRLYAAELVVPPPHILKISYYNFPASMCTDHFSKTDKCPLARALFKRLRPAELALGPME